MVVSVSDLQLLAGTLGHNLRSLEICGCKMISEDGLVDIARYCKDLRSLRLDGNDIDRDANRKWLHELALCNTNCPSLEVLHTQDICVDGGLQIIGQFYKKFSKLNHDGWVTQTGLIALAQGCPHLDCIKVYLLDISNEALECVGTHFKNLRKLRIVLGEEEDVGLGYIGEYGDNLRNLSLSYTGGSDVGLLELSKGCRKLRKLTLKGCPYSEQEISAVVFNMNHSLRYIRDKGDAGYHGVLIRPMVSDEQASLYLFTMEPPLGLVT
nr:hypothetical protein [Tanacetum cinerariifolium]